MLNIKKNYQLLLMLLLPTLYIIIFKYFPMYGTIIAFKEYRAVDGVLGSPFVGLKYFEKFFNNYQFIGLIVNTLKISVTTILFGFPIPILLALSLNSCKNKIINKPVQMITYIPHFISTVVVVGIITQLLSMQTGVINNMIRFFGGEAKMFLGIPGAFVPIYVISNIWQHSGWGSILFLAALSAIDPSLHEAAIVDGAGKLKRIIHIDIPSILPTIIVVLILNCGRIMDVGFEKVLLMQNDLILRVAEVISTYVYKIGLGSRLPNYSYAGAIGLFNSTINFLIIYIVNKISKKVSDTSLW